MGRGDWPENVIVGEQRVLVELKVEFIELYKIRSMFITLLRSVHDSPESSCYYCAFIPPSTRHIWFAT